MATHQLAKGLASLGRHGDTMLMHVSPSEVAGLHALGAMTGRKVTTNPHTGLPEAFDFGDFLTSLIPTGVGFILGGPAGAALGETLGPAAAAAAPVVGGMAAGALVAGAKGEDPLMGGLMGGLGGYGGGNLAGTFGKMGANAAAAANAANAVPVAGGYTTPALEETLKKGIAGPMLPNAGTTNTALLQAGTFNPALSQSIPSAAVSTMPSASENIMAGLKQFGADPFGKGYKAFTDAGGSAMQLASPFGMATFEGFKKELYPEPDMSMEEKRKAEENKYKDKITGGLNLLQASPDLRLAASGGLMSAYATGGTVGSNQSTISSGGIQDLYGTNDQTTGTQQLSKDGYGIGRLETLVSQGSNAKAADLFYAAGGPVSFAMGGYPDEVAKGGYLDGPGDGLSDSIPATIEGKQPARLADGEFVVSADVVSALGNGSSKAGAKQLYAMMDRVRQKAHGTKKQIRKVNTRQVMPV